LALTAYSKLINLFLLYRSKETNYLLSKPFYNSATQNIKLGSLPSINEKM